MDNTLPQTNPTPQPQNNQPVMGISTLPKFKLLALGIMIVFFIIVIAVTLFFTRSQTKPQTLTPSPSPNTMTGLQIAEKTAQFLTKAQDADGRFALRYQCFLDRKDCLVSPTITPSSQIIVALNNLSKQTSNNTYKQMADRATEAYLSECQQDAKTCGRNHAGFRDYFKETQDPKFKEALLKISPDLMAKRSLFDRLASSDVNRLASLYEVTGDQKYLELIVEITDQLMAGGADSDPRNTILYTDSGFPVRLHDLMALDFTFLPAYRVTQDPKYLEYVKTYLTKAKLAQNIGSFKESNNLSELIYGMDAALQVGSADNFQAVAQTLINDLWDNPNNVKYNGDFGFLQYYGEEKGNAKATITNAWFITILLQLKDQTFQIK